MTAATRILILLATVALCLAVAGSAAAEVVAGASVWEDGALTEADLAALGEALSSDDEAARQAAFADLSHLAPTALPSIRARLLSLDRSKPSSERIQAALTSFRHAVGSNRADDDVDIAPGIPLVLRTERTPAVTRSAEIILLLRSLENIGTPAAGKVLADGLAVDVSALSREAVRIRNRLGLQLLPALIELRGHESVEIRRWASRGLKALAMTDPTVAVQQGDAEQVAATLRAYGATHDLEALPVVVSFLNDPRIQVRTAARDSVREFGRNAIWKLRVTYQEVTGQNADPRWDVEKTLVELCVLFDRARIERAETAFRRGKDAHLAGDLLLMAEQFEVALRVDPRFSNRSEMAPGFAALGAASARQDNLREAQHAYRSALRLAPEHADSNLWRAELSYLQAERTLSNGVVDMDGYNATLALVPDHGRASDAIDRLSGAWSERAERNRRLIALASILLLCGFGFGVLRGRNKTQASPADTVGVS